MKKLFALVSMAALIASCTNDDFLDAGQQDNQKVDLSNGIVFGIADDATTRGCFEEGQAGFGTFWNAEMDRIAVAFLNTSKGKGVSSVNAGLWCGVTDATEGGTSVSGKELGGSSSPSLAIYKTTKSGTKGLITSVNDDNLLNFSADKKQKASFRVFRPAYTVTNGAETTTQRSAEFSTDGKGVGTMNVELGDFTTQVQPTAEKVNFANFFMVANPINEIHSADLAVGESLELGFERPLSLLAIKTVGYDKDVYGKLKSVKVAKTNAAQKLSSSDAIVDVAKKVDGEWKITEGTASNKVELKLADATPTGLDWSDDYYAYIQVLPVDKGEYTVTLTFDKGEVVMKKAGTNPWVANNFHKISVDLNSQDVYLDDSKELIINKGDLLKDEANFTYGSASVAVNTITEIVANKALSSADLAILKKQYMGVTSLTLKGTEDLGANLTNIASATVQGALTSLTLTEATMAPAIDGSVLSALATLSCPKATSVPANAYNGNTVLSNVNLPLVETIGEKAFNGATLIQKISCEAPAANQLTIGTTTTDASTNVVTKSSALKSIQASAFAGLTGLTTIDIPSQVEIGNRAFGATPLNTVTELLLPQYDYSLPANMLNTMVLLYGTALQTVDLSAVSTIDGSSIVFSQSSLTTVTLKEGVEITGPAFRGCTQLATVKNLDKAAAIGESAFEGTALVSAKINAETIGKKAFKGCTSLTTLTLGAKVKTIGEGAFSGAGLTSLNNSSVTTTIGKEAFKGCQITIFDFLTTTTIGEGAFEGMTTLTGAVSSNVTTVAKNVFKGVNGIDLFRFYKATTIEEGALANIKTGAQVTFSSVLTSIDANAFTYTAAGGDGSTAEKAITGTVAINLTLNAEQTGVTGNEWAFQGADEKYYKLTFTSIAQ